MMIHSPMLPRRGQHVANWHAMLEIGLEAMDETASMAQIEARLRTGRPLASPRVDAQAERDIHRKLVPAKRRPKPRGATNWGVWLGVPGI
jgi:putative transposase